MLLSQILLSLKDYEQKYLGTISGNTRRRTVKKIYLTLSKQRQSSPTVRGLAFSPKNRVVIHPNMDIFDRF